MSDPLQVAQRYFDAWNRRDADGIVAAFAEGGTYSDPLAQGLSGQAIAAYACGLWQAFPDLSFEIVGKTLAADGLVAAQWVMKGTNTGPFRGLPPSQRAVALPGADFVAVEGDKVRSVQGYFDAGEVPRQLGLQILVQPDTLGPFRFGYATAAQTGKRTRPGAFSITALHTRSEEERERVREYSRNIAVEMMAMPEFIGWTGLIIGDRMITVTAWENTEAPRRLLREGAHVQAMREFYGSGLATAGYTSVWAPARINTFWVRCQACGRMIGYEKQNGLCECGQTLPEPPPYW